MTTPQVIRILFTFILTASLATTLTAEERAFKSELFETGTLVYSDDFDREYNKERWGPKKKDRRIQDGVLIFTALFENAEVAQEALGRDHHLGLAPVAHLNKIPERFVCHLRFKFTGQGVQPGRPVLQIGHHMIVVNYLEDGGHRIKLPDGPVFTEPGSSMKMNEWVDLVIEYKPGKILIGANGYTKTYEHERVTTHNPKDKFGPRFTFKHYEGPDSRLLFDSVRLWETE
ncbi:MAG: hypothetical protein ACYTGQ_10920 [Planctomycetota bacterium]|jgi:hypothetical protein